jgi:DNA-binding NarL/FixJ family response regulator
MNDKCGRTVLVASEYPCFADAVRGYLTGHYEVVTMEYATRYDGMSQLERYLTQKKPSALIVDSSFPYDPQIIADCVKTLLPTCGLIYVEGKLSVFNLLYCLEHGFVGYLFAGDLRADSLKTVVDKVRSGEPVFSPTVANIYDRFAPYRGLLKELPKRLALIFKLMSEGLGVQQIASRTGLPPQIIYRRQYRLRQYFGVTSNEELVQLVQGLFDLKGSPERFS